MYNLGLEVNKMKNRLKELRKSKKLSQKAFAIAFDDYIKENKLNSKPITNTTVSRWENNQLEIPNEYLKIIANYFDVTVQFVQGLTYDKNSILKIINDSYLENLECRKVDNKNIENFEDLIDDDPFNDPLDDDPFNDPLFSSLCEYLNYHGIKPDFSNSELKDFNYEVKQFWNNKFSFVFESYKIMIFINLGGKKDDLEEALSKVINDKFLEDSKTIISQLFEQTAQKELADFICVKDELVRFGSYEEIDQHINDLVNSLREFESTIQSLPENPSKPKWAYISEDDLPF